MSRLIIDVTYLAHWSGRLTGIPRVIDEVATRYMASSDVPIFVVWDNLAAEFYQVDIRLTVLNRGSSLHYLPSANKSSSATHVVRKGAHALQKLKTSYRVPVPGRFINLVMSNTKTVYRKMDFQKDDVLLIPMGEWHNQAYINTIKSLKQRNLRLVQISYDVLPLVQPQYSGHSTVSMDSYNRQIMPLCDLVLSISENTKKDLINWLKSQKLQAPNIKVFRLGDDFQASTPSKPSNTFFSTNTGQKNFILCVGTIEARKNHTLLYYTYKLAKHKKIKLPHLIIVGRKGWRAGEVFDLITDDPDTKATMTILTDVSDDELSWLYQHAQFSVYPSFYEGWGLPVAESALRGLPCAASNTSSIPEIAGDLLTYFSPASTDECLKALEYLASPDNNVLSREKLTAYKPTTWEQTFEQLDAYIREVR